VVTVAIPTLNGGETLERVLAALQRQRLPARQSLEVLVCDSGSRDGTPARARALGAEVVEIPRGSFSHGGTRNLLVDRAQGDHVVLLTQDAVPADDGWLAAMLSGFDLADDVALVYGPYRPRPGASVMVAHELTEWFGRFAPDGRPRLDRLAADERTLPARALLGPRAYFTDANGAVAKAAWREVPFQPVPYAEDHVLALAMLRAGYAKVFMPDAAVVHSHEYSAWDWMRRAFDESRGLHQVYGWAPPLSPLVVARNLKGRVGGDWRWAAATGHPRSVGLLRESGVHHAMRMAGGLLGGRSHRLPDWLARRLSLEGRVR
jgi:glycosyltransferase involved in cell wall biosynthesis